VAPPDPRGLSTPDLRNRIRELDREIARLKELIPTEEQERKGTRRLVRGAALTIGGLILAPPLGVATLLLTAVGLWDWVDGVVEDNQTMNKALAARNRIIVLTAELDAAETELHSRLNRPKV
jgi:hypothetical protein